MVKLLRFKQLFITVALLFGAVSSFASDFEVDGICYNVVSMSDQTCEVVYGSKKVGEVVIPSTVTYNDRIFNVTSIASWAFLMDSGLTSISIPEGVTSIGSGAFGHCSGLTSINIPERVTSIKSSTFYNCSGLSSINIPDGVITIGDDAFRGCSGLSSINIPAGVTLIGDGAFYGCTNLTSLTVGNNYTLLRDVYGGIIETITIKENYTDDIISSISQFSGLKKLTIKTSKELYWKNVESVTSTQLLNVEVIVPQENLVYYKSADIWKDFSNLKGSDDSVDTPDTPETCEAPTITFDHETKKLVFASATEGAECHFNITSDDFVTNDVKASEIELTGVYTITAYASADGMYNSEKTTAKLCWVNAADDETGILNAKTERGVIISTSADQIIISGTVNGETIEVYNVGGSKLMEVKASDGITTISGLQSGNVYIVKIGGNNVKVAL